MRDFSSKSWFVLALVLGFMAAAPVHAQISVDLAKKCRSLMIKAHPTELYGATSSAAAQRAYYQKCISQQGQMPEAAQGTTTGQGN
jgi:hypothetical protein